jgi:hypothetical protein
MIIVHYAELRNAFEFVSSGSRKEHQAYICGDTGAIYWHSNVIDLEDEVPDDLETSDRYLPVPHKNMLKLGQSLALEFIDMEIPDAYNTVANLFRKRGAYRRFRELLQSVNLLEKWYAFEKNASDVALMAWCAEQEIQLTHAE